MYAIFKKLIKNGRQGVNQCHLITLIRYLEKFVEFDSFSSNCQPKRLVETGYILPSKNPSKPCTRWMQAWKAFIRVLSMYSSCEMKMRAIQIDWECMIQHYMVQHDDCIQWNYMNRVEVSDHFS